MASAAQKSQFTVIRYDLRAHGQSDLPRAPFSHVNDLFDVLDELHIDKVALIGLSAGSTIALDAALQSPAAASETIRVGRGTCAGTAPPGGLPYRKQQPGPVTRFALSLPDRQFVQNGKQLLRITCRNATADLSGTTVARHCSG